jgi:hypothetical protein
MKYKLTKNSLSLIRTSLKGVKELEKEGYIYDGKVNDKYEVIDTKRPSEKKGKK